MSANEKKMHRTYWLLGLTTLIWGIQPLCIKWLITAWSSVTITSMRYLLVGPILIALAVWRGESFLPPVKSLPGLILMGIVGIGFNNVLQFSGLSTSTVTNCTLIAATSPALTAFLAAFFVKERLGMRAWGGILLSFAGAMVVISRGSLEVIRTVSFQEGDILFLLSQLAWAVYALIGARVMSHLSVLSATGWSGFFGAIAVLLFGLAAGSFHPVPLSGSLYLAFFYIVAFGGVLAMLCWNLGIHHAGASLTAIFQNIIPLVGMLGGVICFHETIGWLELVGAAAIFTGVYLTTHGSRR